MTHFEDKIYLPNRFGNYPSKPPLNRLENPHLIFTQFYSHIVLRGANILPPQL